MLHKRHNTVITLAILLTLVGVSKPAKAFLLAQSNATPTTFTVPDRLAEDAEVSIVASNSTDSITNSLTDGFNAKYPQAEVTLETQESDAAIASVRAGEVDLAAIGRNLTEQEKAQGLIAVPISREKIAIVVSNANPYDGNLTIGQFAQIFRGEITDWSEIGGAPGAIKLVDMPADNDTRQAFPNYPVFQEAEFRTGSTAIQVEEDSTDAMAAELGENGIGYAVANDVIDRDDVKIVTMHQTQPDDPRYPFSQPFNLVYQGTPSEAAQAYLGYANTEGGQQVVANRVGSISTATVAAIAGGAGVASNLDPDLDTDVDAVDPDLDADVDASVADADLDTDVEAVDPDAAVDTDLDTDLDADVDALDPDVAADTDLDTDVDASVADTDLDTDVDALDPDVAADTDLDTDVDASVADTDLDTDVDALDPDVAADTDLDTDVDASVADTDLDTDVDALDSENADSVANAEIDVDGEDNAAVNSDLDDSGELNPDLDGSGVVDSDLDGSGELNPDLDGSGVVDSDLDGSGELNPDLDGSGDPLTVDGVDGEVVVPNDIEGTEVAEKKGRWWLWLLPLLVIPLAIGAKALLGGGKSDREPAVDNVPNVNPPNGGVGVAGTPGGGVPPVGANISSSVGTAVEGARTSGIGAAGLAAGGAAIAGGAALAGRKNRVENTVDTELDPNLDLDPDLDLEGTSTIEEIPSNPVSEFTSQDTKLQIGDQDTKLQIDEDIDIDDVDTDLGDGFSPSNAAIATGMAGLGGAAIAGYTGDRTESISEDLDELDLEQNDNSAELNTEINNLTESDLSEAASDTATSGETVGREFLGDYVLQEETSTVINNTVELDTDINIEEATIADDLTPDADLNADAVSAEIDTSVDVPSSEQDTDLDFDTINPDFPTLETPSTAEINSGSVATPEVDLDVDAANVERPEPNTDSGIVDRINSTGGATIAGGAAVLGGAAAAASGMFNRGRDSIDDVVEDTTIDVPSSEQDTDIDFDTINPDFPTLETPATTEVDTSVETNTSVYVPSSESDTDIDFDTINPDFPTLETPATTEVDTSVETDTSVYVPSSESDTDFDTINPDFPTLEAPATAEINSGSVATPEVDLDVDVADVERPEHSTDSGIVDRINSTGGAAIAGGTAALGGAAAAASGMFNRGRDSIDDVVEDTTIDAPSSEQDTDLDLDTVNADLPTLETPATTEVDASVETDTSVYVPSSESDTDSDLDTVNADLPTLETPSTAEVDTSVDVPSSETDTDLDLDTINADLPTLETPSTAEINSGSVATPEVNLDVDVADVDRPEPSTDSGIVDRINSTGGAAIAGGAAALGGAAAAASGMFNRERDSIDDVVEDTSVDVPSSESDTDTDTDFDTINADFPTLETPATTEVDASVETDTSVYVPSSETDTDSDLDTVNADLPTLETPSTAEVDTSVDVPSSETDTDLDLDTINADLPTLETPSTVEINSGSVATPEVDLDVDVADVDRPEPSTDSGIVDRINSTGGAAIAGGAAALGGAAAAASGMFNRERDSIDDVVEDTSTDVPSSESETDTDTDTDTVNADLPTLETPATAEVDTSVETDTSSETDTDTDTDTVNAELPTLETPATAEVDTSVETDTSIDVPSSETETDLDLDTVNADLPTLETPATAEVDTSVETDTSIDVPSLEIDTDLDSIGTINGDITGAETETTTDSDILVEIDTGIDTSDEIDTGIDVSTLDLDSDQDLIADDAVDEISGAVVTPEVADIDSDTVTVDSPSTDVDSSITDDANPTGGAAIAGGAAILGGAAAAASGIFNRENDTVDDAEDISIDVPSSEPELDFNLDDIDVEAIDTEEAAANVDNLDTSVEVIDLRQDATFQNNELIDDLAADPNLDTASDTSANVLDLRQDDAEQSLEEDTDADIAGEFFDDVTNGINRGGVEIAGSAAALGGDASELLDRDTEDTSSATPTPTSFDFQEFETFETSFDLAADTQDDNFADNIVADAETTSIDDDNDLSEITLDSVTNAADLNLDELTLDNVEQNVSSSLEEITFDDLDAAELSSDDISLENADDKINANLDEITFDSDRTIDYSLEEITFDDVEANSNFDLNDIANAEDTEIRLDDLGFEELDSTNDDFKLLENNTAEIASASDDESNDMNNISEWLDSLEAPKQDNESIVNWLDTLDKDSVRNSNSESNRQDKELSVDLNEEADDISFEFLEDLLDRDANSNREN